MALVPDELEEAVVEAAVAPSDVSSTELRQAVEHQQAAVRGRGGDQCLHLRAPGLRVERDRGGGGARSYR